MNRLSRLLILVPLVFGLGACAHQRHRDDRYGQYPASAPMPAQGQQTQYGTVRNIEQLEAGGPSARQGSGGGAIAGALFGGVVGNQMGRGGGRAAMTVIGAVGGAIAGDALERQGNGASGGGERHTVFRVRVRLDHGGEAQYDFQDLDGLKVGDRVRLENGRLHRT